MKAEKRLYVNADRSKVVDENSPEAAYLLYGEGQDISNEDVKKYNLDKSAVRAEAKSEDKPVETKAVEQSDMQVENKAAKK